MKKAGKLKGILLIILIFAAAVVFFSSIVITKENQYNIIKRFGKIVDVNDKAGLSFKAPFIDNAYTLPKNVQFYDMPESDVITKDKKAMVVNSFVLWKIVDPIVFAKTLNSTITAEGRIDTTVYNSVKNVISSLDQTDVISGRDGTLNNEFMDKISNSMDQYGIELISIETKRLDLPSDNKEAVYQRMISERDQMAATYTAEGESKAQIIHNETDKEVAISISDAETEAAKIIAEGEAEYMKILSEAYSDDSRSDFYTFVRALDAAKASLTGDNKTLILSADSPIAQIFYQID
jgi:membrane protease subunit HflC